jgi:DNA-binding MarR family transcriptional regulator
MLEVYEITSVAQAKVFSHELRMKIIKCFMNEQPRTAKQIADELEMPASKVHYHVIELVKVGLLELVDTRENSGIIEKYYLPVAKTFSINLNKDELTDEKFNPQVSFLMNTVKEVKASLKKFPEEKRRFQNLYLDLTDEEREEFLKEVEGLFEKWNKKTEQRDTVGTTIYGLLLGIYPFKKNE